MRVYRDQDGAVVGDRPRAVILGQLGQHGCLTCTGKAAHQDAVSVDIDGSCVDGSAAPDFPSAHDELSDDADTDGGGHSGSGPSPRAPAQPR